MNNIKEELINNRLAYSFFNNEIVVTNDIENIEAIIKDNGSSYNLEIKEIIDIEELETEIILQTETDKIEELIKYILEVLY